MKNPYDNVVDWWKRQISKKPSKKVVNLEPRLLGTAPDLEPLAKMNDQFNKEFERQRKLLRQKKPLLPRIR